MTLKYEPSIYSEDELAHHGVKGMRWGVRRYQNYDGSYTKKGLERYRKADDNYAESERKTKEIKAQVKAGTATKEQLREAKATQKENKKKLNEAYDQLKLDNKADKGKKLYQEGHRITANDDILMLSEVAVAIGASAASRVISQKTGNTKMANISAAAIAVGGTAVNALLGLGFEIQNDKLRAYYAH